MAFLRRKLSPDCTGGGDHDEYCFPNSPPPILPPAANPGAAEEFVRLTNQSPANRLNRSRLIPICASLLAFVVILFTYYVACRWYPALLRRRRRRRSAFVVPPDLPALLELPAPVEDDGDLRRDLLAGDGGGEPYHVWFIRTKGLDEQTIGAISVCPYRRSEGLVEGTDCSICLGEFTEGETLRLLPKCNHAFHLLCIDTWLRSRVNCPLCRAPILASSPPPAPIDPEPAGAIATPEEQGSGRGEDSAPEEAVVALAGSSSSGGESEVWVTIELAEQADDRAQGVKLEPLRRSVSVDSGVCFLSRIAGRPRAL